MSVAPLLIALRRQRRALVKLAKSKDRDSSLSDTLTDWLGGSLGGLGVTIGSLGALGLATPVLERLPLPGAAALGQAGRSLFTGSPVVPAASASALERGIYRLLRSRYALPTAMLLAAPTLWNLGQRLYD